MVLQDRKKEIFDILYEDGRTTVSKLAGVLYVSEMTIRRVLNEMEQAGILKRYRGGAVLSTMYSEMPISQRFFVEENDKK